MPKFEQIGTVEITDKEWLDVDQDEYGAVIITHWRQVGDHPKDRGSIRFSDEEARDLPEALEDLAALLRGY